MDEGERLIDSGSQIALLRFETLIEGWFEKSCTSDVAHDLLHTKRVVKWAKRLALSENAEPWVVIPAAWLHDCVSLPKSSPDRAKSSLLSAERGSEVLAEIDYPKEFHSAIFHAIHAHSFSANVPAQTIEAKVVQDADRLEAIGALGLARCLMLGGAMGKPLYSEIDPFCLGRPADDSSYVLDHFFVKLLKLAKSFQTKSGREEANRRDLFLRQYLQQLEIEIQ